MVRWIVLAAALLLIGLGAFWPDDSPSIAWQSPAGLVVLEPAGAVLLEDEVGEALVGVAAFYVDGIGGQLCVELASGEVWVVRGLRVESGVFSMRVGDEWREVARWPTTED